MRLNREGIPARVLRGESRKYYSVYTTYKSNLVLELVRRINAAFWAKADGGSDDLGNKWKPLASSTHAYKPYSPIELNTYEIDDTLTRGLLTPDQDRKWKAIYARTYNRLIKKGVSKKEAAKKAAKRAWGVIKAAGARTKIDLERITKINIRYGRLVAATKPGQIVNNRYYPPTYKQQIDYRPRGDIRISFDLPYADAVDAVRPIIPNDISPWVIESHEIAIGEAKKVYERIRAITPDRKRRRKRKSTGRTPPKRGRNPPRR